MTCSGCGAAGVNIRTCPGDGSPHEATTEYQERTNGPRQVRPREEQTLRRVNALRLAPRAQAQRDGHADVQPDHRTDCDEADARDDLLDDLATSNEGVERSESWGDLRPTSDPDIEDVVAEVTPRPVLEVSTVTVRLATTYPALAAARLEAFIEDALDECLWLSTDLARLVPGED